MAPKSSFGEHPFQNPPLNEEMVHPYNMNQVLLHCPNVSTHVCSTASFSREALELRDGLLAAVFFVQIGRVTKTVHQIGCCVFCTEKIGRSCPDQVIKPLKSTSNMHDRSCIPSSQIFVFLDNLHFEQIVKSAKYIWPAPKRRFWKVERTFGIVFSKHFSKG